MITNLGVLRVSNKQFINRAASRVLSEKCFFLVIRFTESDNALRVLETTVRLSDRRGESSKFMSPVKNISLQIYHWLALSCIAVQKKKGILLCSVTTSLFSFVAEKKIARICKKKTTCILSLCRLYTIVYSAKIQPK